MYYKIIRITDLDEIDKTDKKSRNRLGRIMEIDPKLIIDGQPYFMNCVYPGTHKCLLTSPVKYVITFIDGLIIKTENSIYHLSKEDYHSGEYWG